MAKTLLLMIVLLLAVAGRSSGQISGDLQQKCQTEVQKLMPCLSYAQNPNGAPTPECCKSVSEIRTADAACLCYLLYTTLKGDNDAIKQLKLDGSRMRALPTVCKLQNTSISDCPALLKLSPGSPDAALFNPSATPGASPTTTTTATTTTTTGGGSPSSDAYMLQLPFSRFGIYAVFVAAFFIIFPTWP